MENNFRRIFFPTPEEQEEDMKQYKKLHYKLAKDKDCSTCKNKKHIISYPGFVTGEEWECTKDLKCDTVLFSVKNCPKWEDDWKDEF